MRSTRKSLITDPLDDVLLEWPDGSLHRLRDLLRSVSILGITGSGKSSGSVETLLDAIVSHPRSTLLVISQKPEEKDIVKEHFKRHGKADKLIIIGPDCRWRTNMIDVMRQAGADSMGLTEFAIVLGEALDAGEEGGRENEAFWKRLKQRIIFNTIEALRLGGARISAPLAQQFISSALYEDMKDWKEERKEEWRKKAHYQVMSAAAANIKANPDNHINRHNWMLIEDFWNNEFKHMDDKPRSSSLADINNVWHVFNQGICRAICSQDTNISPEVFDHGYSVLIDFPFSGANGTSGRFIAGAWKYLTQRHILRRKWKPSGYFNVMVLDEYQESFTSFDPRYVAQCRSHGGCMLVATQTHHSEFASAGGSHGAEHRVKALQSNFGLRVFHTCDAETAKAASEMTGMRKEVIVNPSYKPADNLFDSMMGRDEWSFPMHVSWQPVLRPHVFMHGLRTGGPANDYTVDGIIIRFGEPFHCGRNWQLVEFRQKGH